MANKTSSREHVRRLELVMQHTTNMVVITNGLREIVWVNPAYTRITGWTLDEVRGRNPKSFLHGPRTNSAASARLGELLRQGQPVNDFELLNYKKSGEAYWVSLSIQPVLGDDGRISEYVAIQSDISERKRAEFETARALRRLAEAQRLARLGTIEHDLTSGRTLCSAEVCRLLGIGDEAAELDAEALLSRVHPDDAEAVRQSYEEAVNAGRDYDRELRVVACSGGTAWVRVCGQLEGWDDGRPALFRLAVQDITQSKFEEQLRYQKELLERTSATRMEAFARVSHEMRTPLHAVLGYAELVERQSRARLGEQAASHLRRIRESAHHLLATVNDVLDLTQLHSGRIELKLQPVELRPLLREAMAMIEPLAAERGVRLQLRSNRRRWVTADRLRLAQVLVNLLANAVKYNRRGGVVEVGIEPAAASVAVTVSDTGIGIAAGELERVFEPFYRIRSAVAGQGQVGTGLGLAIARSLVGAMAGQIRAESPPGAGSTFVVTLPAAAPALDRAAVAAADGVPATGSGSVLYIEDSEVNRLLIESYLEARPGIVLHCEPDGRCGIEAARRLRPALILVDMQLPDMTGIDIVRTLLDDPHLRRAPCVAFSANLDEATIEKALRAGFRGCLHKPIGAAEFLAAIDDLLAAEAMNARV